MSDTKMDAAVEPREEQASLIPDDPEQSIYRFIIVAAKRARQMQSGSRPKIPAGPRKVTRIALEETRRGLVPWMDQENVPPEPVMEEEPLTDQ